MIRNLRNGLKLIMLSVLALVWILPATVMADTGLKVDGAMASGDVTPGETYTHEILISSDANDPAYFIELNAAGLGQSLDGAFRELSATDDASPYSAREYITSIDVTDFILNPSEEKRVTATIAVPEQLPPGGKYACIYVKATPKGSAEGLASIPSVHIPVVLTVGPAESLTSLGEITDLSVAELITGKPIEVYTTLENTGNYHYRARNDVAMSDADGNLITYSTTELTYQSIIPTFAYQFVSAISVGQRLPRGIYYIESKVTLEDGTVLDIQRISIELTKVYYTEESSEGTVSVRWFYIGFMLLIFLVIGLLLLLIAQKKRKAKTPS